MEVAPDPGHVDAFAARLSAIVQSHPGWTDDDLRSIAAPVLLALATPTSSASNTPPKCISAVVTAVSGAVLPGDLRKSVGDA